MYDNDAYCGSVTPPLPEKQNIRRRRSPLYDDSELLISEREKTHSNSRLLSDEIDRLSAQVQHLKSESTPYPRGVREESIPLRERRFEPTGPEASLETTFVQSLNKLCRPKITPADLPTFDGTNSKSFKSFLREFNDLTRLGEWTEEEKLASLPSVLQKRPKLFFYRLEPELKKTFAVAINEMEAMFDAPEETSIRRQKLHSIKQNETPLLAYLEELEFLFTELEVPDKLQLDFLTSGLRADLQDFVCLRQFKTYNDAVKDLKLKESVKRNKPMDTQLSMIWEKLNTMEGLMGDRRRPVDNKQADVAALMREINRLKQDNKQSNGPRDGHRNSQTCKKCGKFGHVETACRSGQYNLTCWNCGKQGHKATHCRSNANNMRYLEGAEDSGPKISVVIRGTEIAALCDSGAQKTVISASLAEELKLTVNKSNERARGISGAYLQTLGNADVKLIIANKSFPVKVMVIKDVTHPLLLGTDFLQQFGAVIDLSANTISLNHKAVTITVPVGLSKHTEKEPALADRYLYLPPQASTACSFPQLGVTHITSLPHAPIDVRVVAKSEEGVKILISNRTDESVEICQGDMIGEWISEEAGIPDPRNLVDGKEEMAHLSSEHESQLKQLIEKNNDIFADSDEKLGHTHLMEYVIDTGEAEPIKMSPYATTPTKREEIDLQLAELLKQNIIRKSRSPWGAPCLLVKKRWMEDGDSASTTGDLTKSLKKTPIQSHESRMYSTNYRERRCFPQSTCSQDFTKSHWRRKVFRKQLS
eukprot:TCONS_00037965-protein